MSPKKLMLSLPLLARLFFGCADECHTYNNTTFTLNQKTDGRVASLGELEGKSADVFFEPELIDFVNETHALATEGLPPGTKLTSVPEYCNQEVCRKHGINQCAYAVPSSDSNQDRGIYYPGFPTTLPSFRSLSHEIGHLQPGGSDNEIIPYLNTYEQGLMGTLAFIRQKNDEDTIRWVMGYLPIFSPEADLEFPSDLLSLYQAGEHSQAAFFVFAKLVELEGDFQKLREEISQLRKSHQLQSEVEKAIADFFGRYSTSDPKVDKKADTSLALRQVYFEEFYRRFGPETAQAFFQVNSLVAGEYDLVYGLEGLNCRNLNGIRFNHSTEEKENCSGEPACERYQASQKMPSCASLCCLSLEPKEDPHFPFQFRKWVVQVKGMFYTSTLETFPDQYWGANEMEITKKEQLPLEKICYQPTNFYCR